MSAQKIIRPTESEMEILQVIWDKGPSTVREVHEMLSRNKETGYTTTLKLMQIMFEKGLLRRNDSSKSHIYEVAVSQKSIQQQVVNKLINSMFKGSSAKLIMHALGNHRASSEEIEAIKIYLKEIEEKQRKPSNKK
jgi:BlaI family transcriptional regulator, penicillinase repressor